jgi:hypothetical protein
MPLVERPDEMHIEGQVRFELGAERIEEPRQFGHPVLDFTDIERPYIPFQCRWLLAFTRQLVGRSP